jgi:hypothetical protein
MSLSLTISTGEKLIKKMDIQVLVQLRLLNRELPNGKNSLEKLYISKILILQFKKLNFLKPSKSTSQMPLST